MATMAVDTVPVVLAQNVQAQNVQAPQSDAAEQIPVPPQYTEARVQDFRCAGFAPKGYKQRAVKSGSSKRKLDEYQAQVSCSTAQCMHLLCDSNLYKHQSDLASWSVLALSGTHYCMSVSIQCS